ncbi:AAA family ATPase [Azospirillum sp. YIM DDC1]|uniref:AAA family ATPase n=1 Tax=Azospirillum aestuarii TaxID=2802052 RepID=A0ABS1HSH9_9PROT|nr:ATP-binding protein [Azospirillum aestuarii]MBK4717671.1 AAA family ATPase [Azospirillum aestuarii]
MTRLLDLTASNFRGYGATPTTVNLDSDIILFYGPNGFGKTSFAEALEWLFYGSTRRRKRGEVLSATEYGGTYANAHGGQPVEVSARVRLADGREVTLTRRMTDPAASENSVTLIDGALGDFTTFGLLVPDAVYPVIVQHGLQTFIHARPKERRDAISAALGLDEMAAFKTAIDGARRSFQGTPPRPVVEARNRLRLLAPLLADVPETAKMAARWAKPTADIDPAKDIPALVKAARRLGGAKSDDPATLIAALTAARREAERAVFDLTKLTPTSDMAACIQRLLRERGSAAEALAALGKAVGARVAVGGRGPRAGAPSLLAGRTGPGTGGRRVPHVRGGHADGGAALGSQDAVGGRRPSAGPHPGTPGERRGGQTAPPAGRAGHPDVAAPRAELGGPWIPEGPAHGRVGRAERVHGPLRRGGNGMAPVRCGIRRHGDARPFVGDAARQRPASS